MVAEQFSKENKNDETKSETNSNVDENIVDVDVEE